LENGLAGRLASDAQAVIAQARAAISETNEAAANLLPVLGEDDNLEEGRY
jgi:hypothetical protein